MLLQQLIYLVSCIIGYIGEEDYVVPEVNIVFNLSINKSNTSYFKVSKLTPSSSVVLLYVSLKLPQ